MSQSFTRTMVGIAAAVMSTASLAQQLVPRPPNVKPAHTEVAFFHRQDAVHVKFRDDLDIRAIGGALADRTGQVLDAAALALVTNKNGSRWDAVHDQGDARLQQLRQSAQRNLRKAVADLRTEFVFKLPSGANPAATIDALNRLACVEIALPMPAPVAPPLPPNYRAFQGYLNPATVGIGGEAMWNSPYLATGSRVRIADIEYGWNFNHLDLPAVQLIGPAPVDPFNDNNHGTAVLGQLRSISNGWGTTGIAHGDGGTFVAAANTASGYDVGAAIIRAAAVLGQGDVLLIEQQTVGPNYTGNPPGTQFGLVPSEWYQPTYNAIVTAVGNGIVVVEAAGNGSQNLDDAVYHSGNGGHWPFLLQNDSGAIIVGGGGAPGSPRGDRSRLGFSCYGATVDLQGWGEGVFTTGYGNAYSSEGVNLYYTNTFSGTSSASPIVAGACALLLDYYEGYTFGSTLTPAQVKSLLLSTGSPQLNGEYPASQHIGPRPDVVAAANAIIVPDTTPPDPNPMVFESNPIALSQSEVSLTAAVAIDSQSPPVQYYFRSEFMNGGHDSGWTLDRTYIDSPLLPNTTYSYRARARDSANPPNETQESFQSASVATLIENPLGVTFSNVTDTTMSISADGFFSNLGSDNSGLYFEVMPAPPWQANSWIQTSTIYLYDLSPGTAYTVRVKSRNRDGIEGPFSAPFTQATSGGAQLDHTPPYPNPMYFSMNPTVDSASTISMSAAIAYDFESPPVQYYFQNTSAPGHDSGWTYSSYFADSQLPPNSEFSYRVRARDSAPIPNETQASIDVMAVTWIETPAGLFFSNVGDTFLMLNVTDTLSNLYAGQSGVYLEMQPDVPGSGANQWTQTTFYTISNLMPETMYTFRVKARNRAGVETQYSSYFTQSTSGSVDHTPPSPDPMYFATPPAPLSAYALSMSAAVATDLESPPVQYYFQNLYFFGHDSGWTSSTEFVDFGLQPNTEYSYRVRARDSATQPNETQPSFEVIAATHIESPAGMFFSNVSDQSITVNATGVFTNLYAGQSGLYLEMTPEVTGSGGNTWAQSTWFTLSGLSPGTTYTFRIKARNRLGVETDFTSYMSQATSGSRRGDCDGNGLLQELDAQCFVNVLLEHDADPLRIARCDMNLDGVVDGDDIELLTLCIINGCP